MTGLVRTEFEQFLVEDVILTLGNLRGSLAWIGGEQSDVDPAIWDSGLNRVCRQIDQLEERAREMCRTLRDVRADGADANVRTDQTVPEVPASGARLIRAASNSASKASETVETILLNASQDDADEDYVTWPVFRSQRE